MPGGDVLYFTWHPPNLTAEQRRELPAVLAQVRELARPATPEDIGAILAPIAFGTKDANLSDAALRGRAEWFKDLLAGYPIGVLQRAAREWVKTQVWFPAPAEFLAVVEELGGENLIRQQLERLEYLAGERKAADVPQIEGAK